ncbi:hypothetical protein SSX86_026725 [Deinandra increscens subsp. villosa]|uniref:RING-type domain-containing protein n=1 Tax=Deinandra increscens subsp. villosa TaxID=3103831 RepID=A0AAP0CKD9_9ASTR
MKLFGVHINKPTPTNNHELEGGPMNHPMQGGQGGIDDPEPCLELSLRPLQSSPSLVIDVDELYDDDDDEYINEVVELDSDDDYEDGDDYEEEGYGDQDGNNDEDVAAGDDDDATLLSPAAFGQASSSQRNNGGTPAAPLTDLETVEIADTDGDSYAILPPTFRYPELERGPSNPMARHAQHDIHVPVVPVERSLHPQGCPPPGPIDMAGLYSDNDDAEEDDNEEDEEEGEGEEDEDDEVDNDDYSEEGFNGHNDENVAAGDEDAIISPPTVFGQARSSRTQGRTPMVDSESVEIADAEDDNDAISPPTNCYHELERGRSNPMVQRGQHDIHVPVAPVEEDNDNDDDVEEDDNNDTNEYEDEDEPELYGDEDEYEPVLSDDDDDEMDSDDYSEEDFNGHNNENVVAGDEDAIISPPTVFGQASSSRYEGRTPMVNSESVETANNHQHNKRRRVDSQSQDNIRDSNVHSVGASSSMTRSTRRPTVIPLGLKLPGYPVIPLARGGQNHQLLIFLPMFQMDESEQRQEPPRSLPPGRTNVEAVRSRRCQRTPVTEVDSVEISSRNQRRRVRLSPLIPRVNFEGTSSSMLHLEPVAPQSSSPPPPVASQPSPPQPSLLAPICPICWGPMVEETSTKCGHVFCGVCIRSAVSAQAKLQRYLIYHRISFSFGDWRFAVAQTMNLRRRAVLNLNSGHGRFSQDASSRRAQRDPHIDSESDRQTRSTRRLTATPLVVEQGHVFIPLYLAGIFLSGLQLHRSVPPGSPPPGPVDVEGINSRRSRRTPLTDVDSVEIAPRNQRRRLDLDPQPPSVNFVGASSSTLHVEHVAAPPSPPPLPPQPLVPTYDCSVCLDPMIGEAMSTKCGHLFCNRCIRIALSDQAKCPLCRCRITHKELLRIFFPAPI